jgi:hypothetical protein
MSDKKPRGIVDPWRTVDPVHRPSKPARVPDQKTKIDLDDIDRDADLVAPNKHVIRTTHACFEVTSRTATTLAEAFDVFAECLIGLFNVRSAKDMLISAGIGVQCFDRSGNVPDKGAPASTLKGGHSTIWFVQKPVNEGALVLARILRSPDAAATLHRYKVVVMMTAS